MTAISKERMKIMNRRMTINVMTISLLLSLAPVSHGQPLEGCTTASFSQAAGSPVEVGSGPSSVAVGDFNLDGTPDLATGERSLQQRDDLVRRRDGRLQSRRLARQRGGWGSLGGGGRLQPR